MEWLTGFLPHWLIEWLQIYAVPFFKIQARVVLRALFMGVTDTLLFISLPVAISLGSQSVWNARYHLTTAQQTQVERWSSISQLIAYAEDVPPVVPMVLWFKESGLRDENPSNCEGIMGLYSAVASGTLPCFPPGPLGAWAIAHQLELGTRTFKSYCPEITYTTTDPNVIKKCYLHYNAGPRARSDPDLSAYVMNGYDAAHQNMILTDIQGRQHRLTALGAWPAHIAIQTQLAQQTASPMPPFLLAPAMLLQELVDKVWVTQEGAEQGGRSDVVLPLGPAADVGVCREAATFDCFIAPHVDGNPGLRPSVSPLLIAPVESSELMCGLLPGIDLIPPKASVVLAPMPGYLTRYTDGKGNLAVHIENVEWTLWITGLRSYAVSEGEVNAGEPVGAVSGAGSQTPGIHYALYDRKNSGFVDVLNFIPADACPPAGNPVN